MKNLKKVLALVVALTMVLGTVAFAFTDVDVENDAYTAVQTLSSLGILNGYEDGTFGPEKDITRAEFAAVVCRALGLETSAIGSMGATPFTDVPADHWASGYINLAAGQGIINGMGDGTFEPESNVTYEQAVKMLVCALGFEAMAQQKGGYPTGYFVVANTYGLVYGIEADGDSLAANRGVVAQLTYNALDIPMMDQTAYGTEQKFEVLDGYAGRKFKTLLTGLDICKLGGVVTGTQVIGSAPDGAIAFEIKENYGDTTFADEIWKNDVFQGYYSTTFELADGVNADAFFGIASEIYVQEYKPGKWEVIAMMPGADSEIIELTGSDIDLTNTDDTEVVYFVDENGSKTARAKLDPTMGSDAWYINNTKATQSSVNTFLTSAGDDAEIQVINNDTDVYYDMIVVKVYQHAVVDSVDAARDRINLTMATNSATRLSLDFEDAAKTNIIVDAEGNAIELADIAEGDVLAFFADNGGKGTANTGCEWIEIIDLGANVVSGTVTEKNDSVTPSERRVYVDGVEYSEALGYGALVDLGDQGTFYLTKSGKIFADKIDESVGSNYGYILQMDKNKSFGTATWQIKMLTKDGSIVVFDTKDTFNYVGSDGNDYSIENDIALNSGAELFDTLCYGTDASIQNYDIKSDASYRIVTYKTNSANKITEIAYSADKNGNSKVTSFGLTEYSADKQAIGGNAIDDNAVIFNVAGTEMDDSYVTDVSALIDETKYAGLVVRNDNFDVDCVVITKGEGVLSLSQDFAVVTGVTKTTIAETNDNAWVIKYKSANENDIKTVTLTTETDKAWTSAGTVSQGYVDTIAIGSIVMFAADEAGIATDFGIIATPESSKVTSDAAYYINNVAQTAFDGTTDFDPKGEYELISGYLRERSVSGDKTYFTYNTNSNAVIKGAANMFTYDNIGNKVVITADDIDAANKLNFIESKGKVIDDTPGVASYFIAKTKDGIITDIITFAVERNY